MEKGDRQNGRPEQMIRSSEPQRASRPSPGKVTRTSKISPGGGAAVQRKAVAVTPGGGAGGSQARSPWELTMDPWMDAAHRGVTALAERGQDMGQAAGPIQAKGLQESSEAPESLTGQGGGGAMPEEVRAKMETAFGADFSSVRIHEGPHAEAIGAQAYTQGADIHFAPGQYQPGSQRGQELLGHELTHVVQQSQGRVRATTQAKGLEINADPALEREADELGAKAARGEWVGASGGGRASAGDGPVQRYTEKTIKGHDWRIGDDLTMAVRQDSPVYGSRFFFAEPSLISSSSDTLEQQGSNLRLEAGGGSMKVSSSDGKTTKSLSRVVPTNVDDGSKGNKKTGMQWPEDCGEAANSVMQGPGRKTKAVYHSPPEGFLESLIAYFSGSTTFERETKEVDYDTDSEKYKGADFYSPHIMMDEIFKAAMQEKDAAKAWQAYLKLAPAAKDRLDAQLGINKYAQPEVGEAYSIVAAKDDYIGGNSAWNFHWGGVAMRSGGDSITMENFANSGADAWDFQMYGPPTKAGQTFHEQQEQRDDNGTPEYGDNPTTIRVRKS